MSLNTIFGPMATGATNS